MEWYYIILGWIYAFTLGAWLQASTSDDISIRDNNAGKYDGSGAADNDYHATAGSNSSS